MRFALIDFQQMYTGGFGSIGLVTILRKLGHEAYVLGGHGVANILEDSDKLKSVLRDILPDAVGLSVMTPNADYIDMVGGLIHETVGNIPIIVGGGHTAVYKGIILKEAKSIDYVVVGDADYTLPLLLDSIENKKNQTIHGVISRNFNTDEANSSSNIVVIDNLNDIPFPDEGVIHPDYYDSFDRFGHPYTPGRLSRSILCSRGCPFKCTFCKLEDDNGLRSRVRFYSPKLVLDHIGTLKECHKIKGLSFQDDNFCLKKDWAYEICEGLLRNRFNLTWAAQIRADSVDEDLIKIMYQVGCRHVNITVESGNDRIRMEVMQKDITRKQIRRAYEVCRKAGMIIQGTLLMGSPTETYEELCDSISFFRKVNPDFVAGVYITTPLPGTTLHRQYEDRIKVSSYQDYDIPLQEYHYLRDDVKLTFHKIPQEKLLESMHIIRRDYMVDRQLLLTNLRNYKTRTRFVWMVRLLNQAFTKYFRFKYFIKLPRFFKNRIKERFLQKKG